MFEREVIIAGLRKQSDVLLELVRELEDKPNLKEHDIRYCGEVLKGVRLALMKLGREPRGLSRYLN